MQDFTDPSDKRGDLNDSNFFSIKEIERPQQWYFNTISLCLMSAEAGVSYSQDKTPHN